MGSPGYEIAVYIANRPPLPEFEQLSILRPIKPGEIASIAERTGNHWRKVFNVYAKLAYQLDSQSYTSWQQLRDESLLQSGSRYALLFTPPDLGASNIHLVAGKTYAQDLGISEQLFYADHHFARNVAQKLIQCPYFDYRQLSNQRIDTLVSLIEEISGVDPYA